MTFRIYHRQIWVEYNCIACLEKKSCYETVHWLTFYQYREFLEDTSREMELSAIAVKKRYQLRWSILLLFSFSINITISQSLSFGHSTSGCECSLIFCANCYPTDKPISVWSSCRNGRAAPTVSNFFYIAGCITMVLMQSWIMLLCSYRHIYTSNGLTLHDIALSLANGHNVAGSSDDMCSACGEEGSLILCVQCPRAFHAGFCRFSRFHLTFHIIVLHVISWLDSRGFGKRILELRYSKSSRQSNVVLSVSNIC